LNVGIYLPLAYSQAALKTQLGVAFFYIPFSDWSLIFDKDEAIEDPKEFLSKWEDLEDHKLPISSPKGTDPSFVQKSLEGVGMRKMAYRQLDASTGHACMFLSSNILDEDVLVEVEFKSGNLIAHCRADKHAEVAIKIVDSALS